MSGRPNRARLGSPAAVAVLAALAYLPSLTASPGRMVADSKLYLYLDPGRFLADNLFTFDARQFAGWVPHQHIAYLWPSGPWYWLFDRVGSPDWIAHRLWIGTVMLAAGLGARWVARVLGLGPLAALTVGIVYQLSPYVLPYVSRTSVMLLPWAGLGWIVGLTILGARRGGWRAPGAIALVVVTVGAVNATALAMIVPAPVLWLVHAVWGREVPLRRAVGFALRTGVLCVGVSLWWVVMLVVQRRLGPDVVAFSEALDDVALTSSAPEVVRSLGYWLFYVRDAFGPTTTASFGYLTASWLILLGYALVVLCLAGLMVTRWSHRRFVALLIGTGVVLAVGVHPTDDPAPLVSWLTAGGGGGLAEALRSSTRALPLLALGLALGAGGLVEAVSAVRWRAPSGAALRRPRPQVIAAGGFALLGIAQLPALWTGRFTDPVLDRDEDPPAAWIEAASALDQRESGYRVLQLPGAEFGAFRWGYTVDQPLPGLTERPIVTRDLLPLGAPAAMDLAFALDDRAQQGVLEPAAVAPVARWFGADVVWAVNDAAFERFRTARPEVVDATLGDATGLTEGTRFGEPRSNVPDRSMLDERELVDPGIGRPLPDVHLWEVTDPVPVIRAVSAEVVVSGSGDGLVDAAAAGILDGRRVVRYSASLDPTALAEAAANATPLVLTDSHRDRAHHWRSSQDVVGMTGSGGSGPEVLVEVVGDERLDLFGDGDEVPGETQTVAEQRGPVTAVASSYGEKFAYRPESRAAMAVDGDVRTAWRVADRADAVGEFITLASASGFDHVTLRQPDTPRDSRVITAVELAVEDREPQRIELDERSLTGGGQRVDLGETVAAGGLTVTIVATSVPERLTPEILAAVGFAEIDLGLGPTTEWIRPPIDAIRSTGGSWAGPATAVFTRLRTDPLDRWRADPEPALQRLLPGGFPEGQLASEFTVRLHQRAADGVLMDLLGADRNAGRWAESSARMTGTWSTWGHALVDGDPATSWRSPFGQPAGHRLTVRHGAGPVSEFSLQQPPGPRSTITAVRVSGNDPGSAIEVAVPEADAEGRSRVVLPAAVSGEVLHLEITEVEPSATIDPRYGEITELPTAISELDISGAAPPVSFTGTVTGDCREDLVEIDGMPFPVSFTVGTPELLAGEPFVATPCGPLEADGSEMTIRSVPGHVTGLDVDRGVLRRETVDPPAGDRPGDERVPDGGGASSTVVDRGRLDRTVEVAGCVDGCWIVLGEGFNEAWSARVDGLDLGDPVLVDGGFNGWWLPASEEVRTVRLEWTAQRPLTAALAATGVAVVVAIGLVVGRRRRAGRPTASTGAAVTSQPVLDPAGSWPGAMVRPGAALASGVAWVVVSGLLVDAFWVVPAALGAVVAWRSRRVGWIAPLGGIGLVLSGLLVVVLARLRRPAPNGGWPGEFAGLHEVTLWALLTVVVGVVAAATATRSTPDRADTTDPAAGAPATAGPRPDPEGGPVDVVNAVDPDPTPTIGDR